jgi:hypothetical protein
VVNPSETILVVLEAAVFVWVLCACLQTLITEFAGWSSVQADESMKFDWDDAAGNEARRERGLALEKLRNAEMKRKRLEKRGLGEKVRRPLRSQRL